MERIMKAHVGFSQTPVSKEGWVFILVQGLPGPGSLKLGFFSQKSSLEGGSFFHPSTGSSQPGFSQTWFFFFIIFFYPKPSLEGGLGVGSDRVGSTPRKVLNFFDPCSVLNEISTSCISCSHSSPGECQYATTIIGDTIKTTLQEDKSEEYSAFTQKIRNITTKAKNQKKRKRKEEMQE
jgi:hypothetical protein